MDCTATSWRKVFKGLSLVEHLIKNGNERIVEETRDHMRRIRALTDFNFYEGSIDRGSGGASSCPKDILLFVVAHQP
jgi:epsin